MRTIYRQKNNNDIALKEKILIATIIFLFFFLLRFFFAPVFSSITYTIAQPFWTVRDGFFGQTSTSINYTESKSSLITDKKILQDHIDNLQLQNLELTAKIAAVSNPTLQSISQATDTKLLVKVISKPPYTPFDYLIINHGGDNGIAVGDTVYADNTIFIGKIVETENSYSKVQLLSSGSNTTPANILRTGEGVSAVGTGAGNFMINAPKDLDVVVGDFLVDMSDHEAIIAQIYSIDTSSGGSFKKIFARLPFNVLQLDWLSIQRTPIHQIK